MNARCRAVASLEWRRVVPVLRIAVGLGEVDTTAIKDYCISAAHIDQCERELSEHGLLVQGERGWQKNGATTIAGQYRSQLSLYIRELDLSPSARTAIVPLSGYRYGGILINRAEVPLAPGMPLVNRRLRGVADAPRHLRLPAHASGWTAQFGPTGLHAVQRRTLRPVGHFREEPMLGRY
ncbi:P27 family phage terminase small subunit [Streptomyces griseoviridis]